MRRMRIRTKLAIVMFVPVVLIAAVAAVGIAQAVRLSSSADGAAEIAQDATGPLEMSVLVDAERAATHAALTGGSSPTPSLEDLQRQMDTLVGRLESDLSRADAASRRAFTPAVDYARGPLTGLRAGVTASSVGPEEAWKTYTRQTELIHTGLSEAGQAIDSTDLRREFELLAGLARLRESVGAMRAVAAQDVNGTIGGFTAAVLLEGRTRRTDLIGTLGVASPRLGSELDGVFPADALLELDRAIDELLAGQAVDLDQQGPRLQDQLDDLDLMLHSQLGTVSAAARSLLEDASNERNLLLIGAAAAVLVAIGLLLLVGATVSRPLLDLAREAERMAHDDLPQAVNEVLSTPDGEEIEPPPMASSAPRAADEIGEVAAALDRVRESALTLAVEQVELRRSAAESFVNLARRTQSLVARQLEFISSLEDAETDPATLANLFELDHLATRMRRNAESLLVLAGVQPARIWKGPIDIADVIRGALSEVEEYRRVKLSRIDPGRVLGGHAADLSHLIAELLENALEYSPPEASVTVEARRGDDGYRIAVVDRGIGMSDSGLYEANRRLAGEKSFDVAPARHLGHHVAGRLARRIGAAVRIEPNPSGGLAAMIRLAPELVSPASEVSPPMADHPTGPLAEGDDRAEYELVHPAASNADPGLAELVPDAAPETLPAAGDHRVATAAPAISGPAAGGPRSVDPAISGVGPSGDPEPGEAESAEPVRTSSGLVRRLPGANLPGGSTDDLEIQVSIDELEPAARDARTVADLLSGFRGGVEQGRRGGPSSDSTES